MNTITYRYRVAFAKTEAMRYTGHLDLQRCWERLLRRARLPLSYSSGFHPHPRIQIGAALPLGIVGENELVEFRLDEPIPAEETLTALQSAAPPGIEARICAQRETGSSGLEEEIVAGDYSILPVDGEWPADLPERIAKLLQSESIIREKRGKSYNLRPLIMDARLDGKDLRMLLTLAPSATGRPDEVLASLGLEEMPIYGVRETLLLKSN